MWPLRMVFATAMVLAMPAALAPSGVQAQQRATPFNGARTTSQTVDTTAAVRSVVFGTGMIRDNDAGNTRRRADLAFLASLAVPGSGQYVLSQGRWVPYAAVEVWAWIRYLERRSTARRLAEEYRDLAWSVARRVSTGERRDTTFPYYEVLTKSGASGAFDMQPGIPGLQPEQDPGTYNGEQWQLARALFIPPGASGEPGSPEHAAALAYYEAHAIPERFAFAWTTGGMEQRVYTNVIAESDEAYSEAARLLGLILANHLTSSIDALISARLRRSGVDLRFESGFAPDGQVVPRGAARGAAGTAGTMAGSPVRVPVRLETSLRYTW